MRRAAWLLLHDFCEQGGDGSTGIVFVAQAGLLGGRKRIDGGPAF